MKKLSQLWLWLWCLPRSIFFNLKYLPLHQAVRLPFWVGPRVHLAVMQGRVIIQGPLYRGMIEVGIGYADLYTAWETPSLWQVLGTVVFNGPARLGPGFRLHVGREARLSLGSQFKITANSGLNCHRSMQFGDDVIIAWGCQFSDSDRHAIINEAGERLNLDEAVEIGDHVWAATNVVVLRGSRVANGCILAAGAVIKGEFNEPACLIAGAPARVVKRGVFWRR